MENCQNNILSLEGSLTSVNIYNEGTVGVVNMLTENGVTLATSVDNLNAFPDNIALFQLASGSGGSSPPPTTTTSSGPTTLSTVTTTTTQPASSGWTALGCYSDNVDSRSLVNAVGVTGGAAGMTIELCEAACKANGYTIAGVEYADECCKYYFIPSTFNIISDNL